MSRITNETLAALMTEQHRETSRRLDSIDARVAETNGRLRTAETNIAVLQANSGGAGTLSIPKKWLVAAAGVGTGLGAAILKIWQGMQH